MWIFFLQKKVGAYCNKDSLNLKINTSEAFGGLTSPQHSLAKEDVATQRCLQNVKI